MEVYPINEKLQELHQRRREVRREAQEQIDIITTRYKRKIQEETAEVEADRDETMHVLAVEEDRIRAEFAEWKDKQLQLTRE